MQTTSSLMTSPTSCPHERGPGTTVCLRCRADEYQRSATARVRLATRVSIGATIGVGAVIMGSVALEPHLHPVASAAGPLPAAQVWTPREDSLAVKHSGALHAPTTAAGSGETTPDVAAGRTDLEGGVFIERSGDVVTVSFDTPLRRTRRRDKFEQVVRETLPAVYGGRADSALASVPIGTLATSGDLLSELPTSGVHLPTRDGWAITLWPATRPGHDGPLVVSYRASAMRVR